MSRKLSVKIAGILIIVMIIIMSAFTAYFVQWRSENMHAELLAKGRILAISGAASMERVLTEAITDNKFSLDEIFDTNYKEIPGSTPSKYSTKYDSYLDRVILNVTTASLIPTKTGTGDWEDIDIVARRSRDRLALLQHQLLRLFFELPGACGVAA